MPGRISVRSRQASVNSGASGGRVSGWLVTTTRHGWSRPLGRLCGDLALGFLGIGGLWTLADRAGIRPFAWVINQSLGLTPTHDPLLRAKAAQEDRWLREVLGRPGRGYAIPWREDLLY